MPESIRMGRRKVGFNSPMPEWLNGPLASWTSALLDRNVPAFSELVDEGAPAQDGRPPERIKNMGLGVRVADLALYQYEMGDGTGRVRHASLSK